MKSKQIASLSVIILVVLVVWFLNRHSKPGPDETVLLTNSTPKSSLLNQTANVTPGNVQATPVTVNPIKEAEVQIQRRIDLDRSKDEWRTPIEFYGKVVDENANPVANADVSFVWTDLSSRGNSEKLKKSNQEGLFSLNDVRGKHLMVKVTKEGYYPYLPFGAGFFYAGENHNFSPDIANPVLFRLRKKGIGEPLIRVKRNYPVPRNGTPVQIDLTTGELTATASDELIVECWTNDQGQRSGRKYDWRCRITIRDGGLLPSDEAFPFVAPNDGYTNSTEIDMPADRTDWKKDVDLKFFFRCADGRYGRMTFSMIAGGDHFCMIESLLNPSGSRNLELDLNNSMPTDK